MRLEWRRVTDPEIEFPDVSPPAPQAANANTRSMLNGVDGLGRKPVGHFLPPLLRWTTLCRKGFENQTANDGRKQSWRMRLFVAALKRWDRAATPWSQ